MAVMNYASIVEERLQSIEIENSVKPCYTLCRLASLVYVTFQ